MSQPHIPTQKFLKSQVTPPGIGAEITSRIQECRFNSAGNLVVGGKESNAAPLPVPPPPPTPLSVLTLIPALFINRAMTCDVCSVPANFMFHFSLYLLPDLLYLLDDLSHKLNQFPLSISLARKTIISSKTALNLNLLNSHTSQDQCQIFHDFCHATCENF